MDLKPPANLGLAPTDGKAPVCPPLGELLRDKGLVADHHIRFALQAQKVTGQKLGAVLAEIGVVSEYDLALAVSEQLSLPFIDLAVQDPDPALLARFTRNKCLQWKFLPMKKEENGVLVACADPLDERVDKAVRQTLGLKPRFAVAEERKLAAAAQRMFHFLEHPIEMRLDREIAALSRDDSGTVSPEAFIRTLLLLAVKKRATDVHLRPMTGGLALAFRIDGVLSSERFLPRALARVVTAVKLAAGMDIAEQRLPQDGRFTVNLLEQTLDVRASTLVTPLGENLVLRLLSPENAQASLKGLGFPPEATELVERAFREPYGLVVLAGPTGSGKSTTLTAGLLALDLLSKNVLTVEDPIEYVIAPARQTQVNEAAGYGFSRSVRRLLRHDPDVILIGEIRDPETAQAAVTAAGTGHLVLTTLHANTALGSIPRLVGLGVEAQVLADGLVALMAQRLVRTICPDCACHGPAAPFEEEFLGVGPVDVRRGFGCESCGGTGWRGRTPIHEILLMDPDLRDLIESGASLAALRESAVGKGFSPLRESAKTKVLQGATTVDEVLRVLGRTRR